LRSKHQDLIYKDVELKSSITQFSLQNLDKNNSTLSFDAYNLSSEEIAGLQGIISIKNQFGDNVCDINIEINRHLTPKSHNSISLQHFCDAYKYDVNDLKCNWKLDKVIFLNDDINGNIELFAPPEDIYDIDNYLGRRQIKDVQYILTGMKNNLKNFEDYLKKYYNYN
jgi:hypothetical protein